VAKATLRIELANATVKAGTPLRGEVVVRAESAVHCNGVLVKKRWYAHGRGNTAYGSWSETKLVAAADWSAGMEYRYPFEIATHAAPVTYHGKHLNVDWVVDATADLPWAFDPKAETPFLVTAGDAPASWDTPAPPPGSKAGGVVRGGLALGVFGTLFGGVGTMVAIGGSPGSWIGWLFAAAGFGVVALAIATIVRRKMAEHAIGHPEVRVEPSTARRGDVVVTTFRSRPPGPVTLTGAKLTLVARERVVSGGGKSSTTYTDDREIGRVEIAGAQISTSPTIELEMPVTLPADAPPSFNAQNNHLLWTLKLTIGIQGEPDWDDEFPILVQ